VIALSRYSEKETEPGMQFIRFINNVFLNETRHRIVSEIDTYGNVTWTKISAMGVNPYMIRHHTDVLQKTKIIQKALPHGFELTTFGKEAYRIYLEYEQAWLEFLEDWGKKDPDFIKRAASIRFRGRADVKY